MESDPSLDNLSRDELISTVRSLQSQLTQLQNQAALPSASENALQNSQVEKEKPYYPSHHPQYIRTKIALLFSYQGSHHTGLAYTPMQNKKPTVEEMLLRSLLKSKLVDPVYADNGTMDLQRVLEGCEWERCGRTDAGVSAAGQVVDLMIYTRRRKLAGLDSSQMAEPEHVPYPLILNKLLPPSIRVHAWSEVSDNFSSRHSCTFRHYKYFFTTSLQPPLFSSSSSSMTDQVYSSMFSCLPPSTERTMSLSIPLMREAASCFVGTHDFRNFCRVDASKQLTHHIRNIYRASIDPIDESAGLYCFNLVGSGFLYNQVRHMIALLFLVGQGLEQPDIVKRLLYTSHAPPLPPEFFTVVPGMRQFTEASDSSLIPAERTEGDKEGWEKIDRKPNYEIADGEPLMLWACGFDEKDVRWRFDASEPDLEIAKGEVVGVPWRTRPLYAQMHNRATALKIEGLLADHALLAFLDSIHASTNASATTVQEAANLKGQYLQKSLAKSSFQKYVPLLERNRGEDFSVVNRRWMEGKGKKRLEKVNAKKAQKSSDAETAKGDA
ncbi:pseudouridine synthase [Atractiella rhizophila]|nr:pseudouridine synthase [Atractiella rhizophila]